jgi:exopolysaccharide biosynthesis polyprenyl glycosylphosphotransferase
VFPRSIFVVFASLNALLLLVWRLGCSALLGGYPRRRVLVVGTNATASEVIAAIGAQQWLGLDVVGVVASNLNGTRRAALDGVPVLGRREEVPALCVQHDIDEVIIASDATWQDELLDAFSRTPRMPSRVSVVPSPFEILIGRRETLRLHDIPLIEVLEDVPGGAGAVTKRLFDAAFAAILLVVSAPIMLVVALAVLLTSRGAVIYRQRRVGRGGVPFTILKFRTMHDEAEVATGPVLATKGDPRITPLGRLLRATRLDELPQLWNVLRGDMSFVGPRPERPEFVEGYQSEIQGYAERFKVRPGLTGYAQVNGEYHTSAPTKLKYDLAYIHNRSLWLDLRILSETMKVMLTRRGV